MPPTALLFPGQGSHHDDMDAPWRGSLTFERGLQALGFDPFARLHEGTAMQQPALLLVSLAAWADDADARGSAIAAAGHSLGEYAALVAADVLTVEDAVRLVAERGAAMDEAARLNPGSMTAFLGGDPAAVMALAEELELTVANDNAPGQLVLSGSLAQLDAAEARAADTGARAKRLDVAGAFHSPLMAPAAERLTAALQATPFEKGQMPVFCNSTAAPFTDPQTELAGNLLKPVRWRETLLALRASGVERFTELGPGKVLSGLVKRTLREVAA